MPSSRQGTSAPRMLLIDENVRGAGGHYLELATLLMDGATELGYRTTLATNESFSCNDVRAAEHDILPVLRTRRMNYWSLGVDGKSRARRDLTGRPIEGRTIDRWRHQISDSLSRKQRNPKGMVCRWAEDFVSLIDHWRPRPQDRILINTTDDFVMLGLANALQNIQTSDPLNIDAIFHFAAFASNRITRRAKEFGLQVNDAKRASLPHRVSLFATTPSLAEQLRAVGIDVDPVPYPTRSRRPVIKSSTSPLGRGKEGNIPLKILMAGMPRAEKGRDQIPKLLSLIHQPYLVDNIFQVSMQVRPNAWKRLIPTQLHDAYHAAINEKQPGSDGSLEIVSSDLPGPEYHSWLGTADVGLFLYDAERYVARCSGVLLEMMVAGVPVIVPAKCWLDDQLELAGGDGSVGFRYRSIDEIPRLLGRIRADYSGLRKRSAAYAGVMSERHTGANTMRHMRVSEFACGHRIAS